MDGKYNASYWSGQDDLKDACEPPEAKRVHTDTDVLTSDYPSATAPQGELFPIFYSPSTSAMQDNNDTSSNICENSSTVDSSAAPPTRRANWRTLLPKKEVISAEPAAKKVSSKELQSTHLQSLVDQMRSLREQDVTAILKANGITSDENHDNAIQQLADIAVFGTPFPCVECPDGALVFCPQKQTYVCQGYQSEYTRCFNETRAPKRSDFVLPKAYAKPRFEWLRNCRHPDLKERTLSKAKAVKFEAGGNSQVKPQIIKNNTVVEAGFAFATDSHVVTTPEGDYYTAMLNKVDVSANVNVYCKIQLLKHDEMDSYYVYSCTGTVGAGLEDKRSDAFNNLQSAEKCFQELFKEKTGNLWENRKYFKKRPGMFSLADVNLDYSEVKDSGVIKPGSHTKLHRAVKEVILMISDKNAMQEIMTALKIDVEKMPLGKLSEKTINRAFQLLSDLEKLIKNGNKDKLEFEDANNQFYTLIPHCLDKKHRLPKLNKLTQIKEKCRLLEVLRDFQVAVGVLSGGNFIDGKVADPVDVHYLNLHCNLEYMDPSENDFSMISEYLKTTHGGTHGFRLDIIDVLKVQRNQESSKFKSNLGNRKLLWHGSGTSNFTGILSQGLRIAPPEAPVSGYMFGKGIYFADMVSKSAQYCRTGHGSTCFLLLCDVALGREQHEYHATATRKNNCDSVKGLGSTQPDPSKSISHRDGFQVPMGPAIMNTDVNYYLHYNEYIVYNVDQVLLKYLVKCRLKHK